MVALKKGGAKKRPSSACFSSVTYIIIRLLLINFRLFAATRGHPRGPPCLVEVASKEVRVLSYGPLSVEQCRKNVASKKISRGGMHNFFYSPALLLGWTPHNSPFSRTNPVTLSWCRLHTCGDIARLEKELDTFSPRRALYCPY